MVFVKKSLPLLGLAVCLSAFSQVEPNAGSKMFDDFKGDGFYWYKKEPEKRVEKKEELKPEAFIQQSIQQDSKPQALSTAWLRANLPILRDKAIDDPTRENVANLMYAQRIVLDKGQNFSQAVKETVATDPFLDENNRVPVSQYAQVSQLGDIRKSKDEVLNYLSTISGIWVFVDTPEKCSACESYVNDVLVGSNGLTGFVGKHKFEFKKIYVNTPEGQAAAKALNLKLTPTTVLVVPPNGYYLISQGLMHESLLYERMLVASKAYGLLPKDLIDKANPYGKGILTQQEMAGFSADQSPAEVMKNFREKINGRTQ